MKVTRLFVVLVSIVVLAACGSGSSLSSGDGSSSGGESGDTYSDSTLFYAAVQDVAPSFTAVSSASLSPRALASESWESGTSLYELFYIFQDFDNEIHQGVIDTSNLEKTMWESRNFFENTKNNCDSIVDQIIEPPFDFGNEGQEYNCAYNLEAEDGYHVGGAIMELDADGNPIENSGSSRSSESEVSERVARRESDVVEEEEEEESDDAVVKQALVGFVWNDGTHEELGVMEGILDTSTNELSLDIAVWVDYEGENDYCYRNEIEGNTETHAFSMRSAKGNLTHTTFSAVGKGVAEGDDAHFLVKIDDAYFCIGAEDGETELRAMDLDGIDPAETECAEYQDDVDAMEPLGIEDLACESSDLNPGGEGEAEEGTIFLEIE